MKMKATNLPQGRSLVLDQYVTTLFDFIIIHVCTCRAAKRRAKRTMKSTHVGLVVM